MPETMALTRDGLIPSMAASERCVRCISYIRNFITSARDAVPTAMLFRVIRYEVRQQFEFDKVLIIFRRIVVYER